MAAATQSIREIISSQPTAAAILQRFDIDVCAHANESLVEACAGLQLSIEQVLEKLEDGAARKAGAENTGPEDLSPTRLIQRIVRVHHKNIRQDLPQLVDLAQMVAEKHGERAPELKRVVSLTGRLRATLAQHISKEEQVLFPYIAQLVQAPMAGLQRHQTCFSRVGQPVFMMVQEHEQAKLLVAELVRLTGDFKPPVWACSAFVALYSGLRVFAATLDEHIRLENEFLFPRAIEMEAELMSGDAR